ncbi:ABC transporter ATP-binding protein [Alphaproteobacteria bacterium]|nr:ABC transporter ATP-binding protein [Alphaproteobacteria bacterium]MDB3863449.1 ABC transporter ATP-binding protein [Alphaproteobacteria bacterium]MDC0594419.1 ABC transporter ATP-binding protein [Alphaproteobacteria bacterium]|tara:strand:+ start:168 stop:1100 length:933 start_codon:yes stop_codon:yes gene_type:complete
MNSETLIKIDNVHKSYAGGFQALKGVNLEIKRGEILALLGPNGAGKTTLINAICGVVIPTSGKITVDGHDVVKDFRHTRSLIGLVPQELQLEAFEQVFQNVSYTRGLYGKRKNPAIIEKILKDLSLWDKKDNKLRELSGGMKRRALIAKALSHEPQILFLDEPTAGVDISLRRDMWRVVQNLQASGVTIILTTHYIEEAEAIADRVSVINHGEIVITENKQNLMQKMGQKLLTIELQDKISVIPESLKNYNLTITENGQSLCFAYNSQAESTGITTLLQDVKQAGLKLRDLKSAQTSLENIFEQLLKESA